jgi:hypothetical protein
MPTTACTNNYYNTVVTGVANNLTGGTSIVTFNTPKPQWADENNQTTIQCNAVSLGGFNGLNN